jgi:hypothetical protein
LSYEVRGQDDDGNDKIYLKPGTEIIVFANCTQTSDPGTSDENGNPNGNNDGDNDSDGDLGVPGG